MKNIKKMFAVLIAVCLTFCMIPATSFAYEVSDTVLSVGTTVVEATADDHTICEFIPGEAGVFRVTTTTAGAQLYTASGSAFYVFNILEAEDNTITFDVTETFVNTPVLVGVTYDGNVSIVVEKTGESISSDPGDMPFVNYETTATLDPNFRLELGLSDYVEYVDVTEPHTAVKGDDGFYHLDSEDGPILLVDLGATAPYVNLSDALNYGQVKAYVYDGDELVEKIDFYECISDYLAVADKNMYPMTDDLIEAMKKIGDTKGWYDFDRELGSYLFGETEIDEETGWMFNAAYVVVNETVYGTSFYGDAGNLLPGTGSVDDPFALDSVMENINYYTIVEEGFEDGYYHEFIAPSEGELRFNVYADLMDVACQYKVSNITKNEIGELRYTNAEDYEANEAFLVVEAGDVIQVFVNTYSEEGTIPEGFIDWAIELNAPEGSVDNPYSIGIYSDINEITVGPGETVYFSIDYSAGSTMTAFGDADFEIVIDDDSKTAVDGELVYEVEEDFVPGYITNNSDSELTYTFEFELPEGTSDNPEVIESGEEYTVNMDSESIDGHYYTFTAPSAGVAVITIDTEKSGDSWEYTCDKYPVDPEDYDGYVYGDWYSSEDDPIVNSQTVEMMEGETLHLYVGTLYNYDNDVFADGEIVWNFKFIPEETATETPVPTADGNANSIAAFGVLALLAAAAFVFVKKRSDNI